MSDDKCPKCGIELSYNARLFQKCPDCQYDFGTIATLRRQLVERDEMIQTRDDELENVYRERDAAQAANAALRAFVAGTVVYITDAEIKARQAEQKALLDQPNYGKPLLARLAKAEAVVGKLPLSGDGVRVHAGMMYWTWLGGRAMCRCPDVRWKDLDDTTIDWSRVYSTKEACEAAEAEKGDQP